MAEQATQETLAAFYSALVAALSEIAIVDKSRTAKAGSYNYDYADIGDVVKATRPVLWQHGIVALTPVHAHGDGLACTVILLHTSGERLDLGPLPFPHGKDAQATGSMITYHRRYALLAALGIATGDDDDGKTAVARETRQEPVDGPITAENAAAMVAKCEQADVDVAQVVDRGTNGRTSEPHEVLRSEIPSVRAALDAIVAEREPAGAR